MRTSEPKIVFQFADRHTALQAMETFEELGYDSELIDEPTPKVAIQVVNEDLTSALEIGQAFGGRLLDQASRTAGDQPFTMAYQMDDHRLQPESQGLHEDASSSVKMRTHIREKVNRPEANDSEMNHPTMDSLQAQFKSSDEEPLYDVSSEKYGHFSGDVRA